MKRISICDLSEKLMELTAWGQQAEWLESQQEILSADCVMALKMAGVSKNGDWPTRVAMRDSTKIYFLNQMPDLPSGLNDLVRNILNK